MYFCKQENCFLFTSNELRFEICKMYKFICIEDIYSFVYQYGNGYKIT